MLYSLNAVLGVSLNHRLNTGSFLLGDGGLLLRLLGGLVLGLLLDVLVLVGHILVDVLLGGEGSLPLLDLADCLLGECLLVLGPCGFDFFNIVKGDALDGSLLAEDLVALVLAEVGDLELLVEAAPGSGPSEPLGLELPAWGESYLNPKSLVRLLR